MSEKQKLIDRLCNDPAKTLVKFGVSKGEGWSAATPEERATAINKCLDAVDEGKSTPLNFNDSQRKSKEFPMRTADHVFHKPTGETWVLAYHDPRSGEVSACGWPDTIAKASDCEVVKIASDDEAKELASHLTGRRGERARDLLMILSQWESKPCSA